MTNGHLLQDNLLCDTAGMPISADDDDDDDDDDGGGDDDDYDVGVVGGGDTAGIPFTAQRFSLTTELCNLF